MAKRTGPTNIELKQLIQNLRDLAKKENVNIWKRIAHDLSFSTRKRREVNISKINRYTKDSETIVVPGKVLGTGNLDHKVKVGAYSFSKSAKEKIKESISIQALMKENPKGKNIRIIG